MLNNTDAALIKSMLARSDRQHDIAAYFAVNGGRVGEISKGHTFSGVALATSNVPPPAPYLVVPSSVLTDAHELATEMAALGASAQTRGRLDRIIRAMEASKTARQGK